MNADLKRSLKMITPFFKEHKVERAYLFGSAVTDDFNKKSDLGF